MSDMDYVFKIVIAGESGVGKTTIFRQFIDHEKKAEEHLLATIGVDFHHKTILLDDKTVKLQLWDTAGQERFNAIAKQYFNGTHGCVLVFDLSLPSTLTGLKRWIDHIQHHEVERVILIGNKCDLVKAVTPEQIEAFKQTLGDEVTYLETCGRTGVGVDEAFWQLARELVDKCEPKLLDSGKAPVSPGRGRTIQLTAPQPPQKKSGCC